MKRRCLTLATICCLFGLLFSCQDDYDKPGFKTSDNIDPNLKIAQKNLDDFIKFIEPNTKSFGNELSVLSVVKKSLPLKLKDSLVTPQTRSSLAEIKDSADLYIFTFTKGGNKGYAIVSGEERVPKLYAYVEKGNIADTVINGGLNQALGMIDEIYLDDVLGAYVMGTKSSGVSTYSNADYTKSLTRLEWGQYRPYNRNVPLNCSNITGKAPAGCVPVAVGMVVAAGESIFAVQEDQVNLHNEVPRIYNVPTDPHADWVANFMIKIGSLCEIQYGCGGSSATSNNASKALSHYWMVHQVEQGLNDNWTKNSLNAGRPIIAFGSPASGAGHCWLLDGGVKDANGNYTHFYNNWGYDSDDNGFFAVTDFCKYTDQDNNVTNFNRNNQFIYIFDYPK